MSNALPNHDALDKGQCFSRYFYANAAISRYQNEKPSHLFATSTEESKSAGLQRSNALTDERLVHFESPYPDETITKEDIFYYVYGLLHSDDYRTRYTDNLCKETPSHPLCKEC